MRRGGVKCYRTYCRPQWLLLCLQTPLPTFTVVHIRLYYERGVLIGQQLKYRGQRRAGDAKPTVKRCFERRALWRSRMLSPPATLQIPGQPVVRLFGSKENLGHRRRKNRDMTKLCAPPEGYKGVDESMERNQKPGKSTPCCWLGASTTRQTAIFHFRTAMKAIARGN